MSQYLSSASTFPFPNARLLSQSALSTPRCNELNLLGLDLPPNAMKLLAAPDLRAALLNRPVAGATNLPVARARTRIVARSGSQPNAPKSRSSSAYAIGMPSPESVPQPSKATYYKSPHERRTNSKANATMAPVTSGSTSASESQPDPSHLAMAKAITEQPGLGKIPIDLLVRILPSLIETTERKRAGRRSNSSVLCDVGASETGIPSDSMTDCER